MRREVGWYVVGGVDEYEENIGKRRRDLGKQKGVIGI